jgi:myo-inositol-1-phosphate synthase
MHVTIGGIGIRDLLITSAFDIAQSKVGNDLSEAIFAASNNTCRFATPELSGVPVVRGPTLDGLGKYLTESITESSEEPVDVIAHLRATGTKILVCYLPVGSEKAVRFYAECALEADCAFINCIPVFIASDEHWRRRFEAKNLPLIGDDIKSQVGATIVHRILTRLFQERGVHLDRTYQLNFGGNADFLNMLERERLESKKISKTQSVMSQLGKALPASNVHVGPSDYVPWLSDRKWAYIRLEGTTFGGVPLNMELKLEVWDSPNSAGVVIDAIRCAGLALRRGQGGVLAAPSSYYMKSPPWQFTDAQAHELLGRFIAGIEETPQAASQ